QSVTPGTFKALGIPLLQGRDFEKSDHAKSTPVAIIDETLSRRYWPANDAIGRRIQTTGNRVGLTIVGVVGGLRHNSPAHEKKTPPFTSRLNGRPTRARRLSPVPMVHQTRPRVLLEPQSGRLIPTCRSISSARSRRSFR